MGAERNYTDKGILREERQVLLKRILKAVQFLWLHCCINHQEEHRGNALTSLNLVLYGCVGRHQFVRECCLCDVLCILRREVVALPAERTRPKLRTEVNLTARRAGHLYLPIWVQNSSAIRLATANRLVRQSRGHLVDSLQRCVPKR